MHRTLLLHYRLPHHFAPPLRPALCSDPAYFFSSSSHTPRSTLLLAEKALANRQASVSTKFQASTSLTFCVRGSSLCLSPTVDRTFLAFSNRLSSLRRYLSSSIFTPSMGVGSRGLEEVVLGRLKPKIHSRSVWVVRSAVSQREEEALPGEAT